MRLTRGLLICAVGTLPAVGAHVAAGGAPPSIAMLLVAVLALGAALAVVSSREWSTARLVVALGLTQLGVHGALWLGGGHDAHALVEPVGSLTGPSQPLLHGGAAMVAWHAAAVALSVIVLRHGERLVHLFARLVAALVAPAILANPRPVVLRSRLAIAPAPTDLRLRLLLLGAAERRGPPVALPAL